MVTLLKVDDAKVSDLESQIDNQVVGTGVKRSLDDTYPVFRVKDAVGTRKLFYIPRVTIPGGTMSEGADKFNVETANVHQVTIGSYGVNYRCVAGITALDGYD